MDYRLEKDKIIFKKTPDFDAEAILTCGQMFRYYKTERGYEVITGHDLAEIVENGEEVEIITKNPARFVEFFDLDTDYSAIKKQLRKHEVMKQAIKKGEGIRIAKGDSEEMILSFIISQNNNIARIQKIIERLCAVGEKIDDRHNAFPTAKTLAGLPLSFFQNLGAGYRDVYLYEAAKRLAETNLDEIKKLDNESLEKWLLSFNGIGPKVASCIMLFGFYRTDCFPVDTWMEKVYRQYFYAGEKTRPQISEYMHTIFGGMSGIAQQYLFYSARLK